MKNLFTYWFFIVGMLFSVESIAQTTITHTDCNDQYPCCDTYRESGISFSITPTSNPGEYEFNIQNDNIRLMLFR